MSSRANREGRLRKARNGIGTLLSACSYNRWANARLYGAALDLSDQAYRLTVGVFFGSLHGTLNHLLLTDRLWLKRLTGEGEHPAQLNAILYDDRATGTLESLADCRHGRGGRGALGKTLEGKPLPGQRGVTIRRN